MVPIRITEISSSNNFWSMKIIISNTPSKVQKIRVILGRSENMFSHLQWLSMRNRYFQVLGKFEAICLQNNIAEMYFIMDRSALGFSFYSVSGNASDIHRFPNRK